MNKFVVLVALAVITTATTVPLGGYYGYPAEIGLAAKEYGYGPLIAAKEYGYGPALAAKEYGYGPALAAKEYAYGPALAAKEYGYGPALGLGYGGKFIGKEIGLGGLGYGGYGGVGLGGGYIGGPHLHHGYGGEVIDKNVYSGEKKNLNDESYKKAHGNEGGEITHGSGGYSKGIAALKDNKGESEYYNNQGSGKKLFEDGKTYYGGEHFGKEGKHGGEISEKAGHKKGHVIKGFKSSHHKDENGKTEEYFDEENDEGGKLNFNGQSGSFGEKGASSFKGGHENGEEAFNGHKKAGHYDNEHFIDKANADEGKFGEKKYGGGGSVYGVNNGVDAHSLHGYNEDNRFYKHHPYHVPYY